MAKPFSIQAPEDIAKEYAGNKQRIAQAAQMGIVDPTAAVLAGMFIDRMRSAQVMEAGQAPSVAQQVLGGGQPQMAPMGAPPAPAQGMGAPPPMAPPPQDMAPPPQDMGMAPPPQGMAEGGLAMLPVPDTMFDEPTNGGFDDGYAGGGMVAFFEGGPVKEETPVGAPVESAERPEEETIVVEGEAPLKVPQFSGIPASMYGMSRAPKDNLAAIREMAPQQTKYSERLTKELEKSLDEGEQKKRRNENINMAMIRAGVAMANAPGSILQSATAGLGAALPGFEAGVKEQRAEIRDAVKSLADQEGVSNKAAREAANLAMEMTMKYGTIAEAMKDRAVQIMLAKKSDEVQLLVAQMQAATARAGQQVQLQVANARTGTERLALLAQKDPKFKTLLTELGVFGGSTTSGANSNGNEWGEPETVAKK